MFHQLCRILICRQVITVSCWLLLLAHSTPVWAFHLSFGHRLSVKAGQLSAVNSPQLNPASSLLRPIECRNANNHSEVGICMFSIDCMQNKGVPLSICKHNYFVGTCCRLPDHNNFVGIVYDLRETETNHLLEAREVLGLKEQPSMSASSSPSSAPVMEAASAAFDTGLAVKSSTTQQQQQQLLDAVTKPASTSVEFLDADRYRISSTSLFGPAAGATSPPAPSGESARNADGSASLVFAGSPILAAAAAAAAAADPSKLQLDTNQLAEIHLISNTNNSIATGRISQSATADQQQQQQQPQPQPPLSDSFSKDANELEVLGTFNSVHSPPSNLLASKPAQVQQQQPQPPLPQTSRVVFEQAGAGGLGEQGQQSTVYEVPASSGSSQTQTTPARLPESSGGAPSSSPSPSSSSSSLPDDISRPQTSKSSPPPATTSDQEFTLSTSSNSADHSDSSTFVVPSSSSSSSYSVASSVVPAAPTTTQPAAIAAAAAATGGAPSATQEPSTFVDLVSSSRSNSTSGGGAAAAGQTTTPFTVSLSTAQLPSISYAPPTQQPTALVSSSSNPSSPNPSKWPTAAAAAASASNAQIGSNSSSSPTTTSSYESSLANFSQLYSNQHSPEPSHIVGAGHSKPSNNLQQQQQQHSNSQLHVASKIVTGSSSSSNLIPGLSSLQSAILSHIPFKIASGLSSYLQAAMKPTGSKPLLASNTAPFLQYNHHNQQQQQQHHQPQPQQPNSTRPQSASSLSSSSLPPLQTAAPPPSSAAAVVAASAVRFPDESPASGAGPPSTASTVSFPAAGATSALPSTVAAAGAAAAHDVVRESQRVCGRPQVAAHSSSVAPLAEGAKRRVARIVGGNQSAFGQWPWMVSLRQWRKGAFLHKCGAALLNENWAITAAHCVEDVKVADLLLRLGEFDVSNQEEPYPFVERRVRAVKSHPLFNPKTFEYDLALLKFAEPIKYERNIIPVCVPSGNDSYVDRMATVIGWGRLYEDGPLPDVIQHVDVPIITNNECEKMYKNAGYVEEIPDMFICAGISKGGRDSCEGDSGGPLTMVDHDGRSYLVGIISWGIGCALPSQPGVYTRITAFSGWINELAGS